MPATTKIAIQPSDLIQSPYAYLQAAGSLGNDGSTKGVHLRWFFRGSLGENHLPKGNLAQTAPYQTQAGFNRPDDFVKIYRVPYLIPYPTTIDFRQHKPDRLFENGALRAWEFDLPVDGIYTQPIQTTIQIRFADHNKYNAIRATVDPNQAPAQFIEQYDGLVEVQAVGKLAFCLRIGMALPLELPPNSGDIGTLRMETVSEGETSHIVTCRKKFVHRDRTFERISGKPIVENTLILEPAFGLVWHKMMAENILYARFTYEYGIPLVIQIETYEDFITGTAQHPLIFWEHMGDYALSPDLNTVHNRLDNAAFQVDKKWAKFNDHDPTSGRATVNVNNYKAKWRPATITGDDYIEHGVLEYLTLSANANNPKAEKTVNVATGANQTPPNTAMMNISMLDMLNFVALDFHVARMLGLGTIDPDPLLANTPFIYLKQYFTQAPLESNDPGVPRGHYYMTLPTSQADERLPAPPVLKPVEYGLTIPALPDPIQLTDVNGYVPNEQLRYIKLFREPDPFQFQTFLPFFNTPDPFCLAANTQCIFYGVEYKHTSAAQFQHPEISHEKHFTDHAGFNETMPVGQDKDWTKPLFIHDERTPGIHKYALYGINIFARASGLSNIQSTDETIFPKIKTLLPPSNLQVQLIQKEAFPLLTTPAEQTKLENINPSTSNDDEILVRMLFHWNHVQNIAYQKADTVELFFREPEPRVVRGVITAATDLPDHKVEVTVSPYVNASDGSTVTPVIPAGDEGRFVAARFSVNGEHYMVENIINSGSLRFVLRKNVEPQLIETPLNSGNFITLQNYSGPAPGAVFMIMENLSAISAWPSNLLNRTIDLVHFTTGLNEDGNPAGSQQTHREQVMMPDGSTVEQTMGGIFEWAAVAVIPDVQDDGQGGTMPISGSTSGAYTITFQSYNLTDHPDPEVLWYGGTARIKQQGQNEKSVLEILNIDASGSTLVLKVYDPAWQVVGNGDYTPAGNYTPVETGTNILVNMHPGYRAYLFAETGFDKAEILPGQGEGLKTTYLTVRSVDTVEACASAIATPVNLIAQEIIVPLPPNIPQGPKFATRPGYDGRASYTFDVEVDTNGREPFALVFYRASDQSVLDKLYAPATVDAIRADLAALPPDESAFAVDRWQGLVNVDLELSGPDAGTFKTYHTTPGMGTYRFPEPDNTDYAIQHADPGIPDIFPFPLNSSLSVDERKQIIQAAIHSAFIPILEQPALYKQIEDGYQTSNRKPKIRNANGDRLLPDDPNYDPNPMVVIFPPKSTAAPTHTARCTDYTLDGASRNMYFYYGMEMSNNFTFGQPGPVAGPIRLVNSLPPESPEIRKVTTRIENPLSGDTPAVVFEINGYLPSEGIAKFQIYRTNRAEDAHSIQTMQPVRSAPYESGEMLIDDFREDPFPLFGDSLFYRIIAFREIENEQDPPNNLEAIPSYPSKLVLASLVDIQNPSAPEITFTTGGLTAGILKKVRLKWPQTTYNGTYSLYKETQTGNWELLHQEKSNNALMFFDAGDLPKTDSEEQTIFHRYRVEVENSSGLFSTNPKILTI